MHVHVSAVDALAQFAALLIMAALWRTLAMRLVAKGSPWGDAMLFVL